MILDNVRQMVSRLDCRSVGWSVGVLVSRCWSVGRMVGWFDGWLNLLVGRSDGESVGRLFVKWPVGWP